ncbi:hypothetical protein RRG08_045253 [Elysia crispata]|uniref:Uncharacterized protein n=1 Tax=Elysia crispata TaxID=231223 RepID=A0AAE1DQZ3_9GAST|nr:hypothetical protein RRG08_045253 [Elysia crispata]
MTVPEVNGDQQEQYRLYSHPMTVPEVNGDQQEYRLYSHPMTVPEVNGDQQEQYRLYSQTIATNYSHVLQLVRHIKILPFEPPSGRTVQLTFFVQGGAGRPACILAYIGLYPNYVIVYKAPREVLFPLTYSAKTPVKPADIVPHPVTSLMYSLSQLLSG